MNTEPVTIVFPLHGCEPAKPLPPEEQEALQNELMAAIQKHWKNDGVEAVVQLLEMECAIKQSRACLPGATPHDGGQAYGLQQVLSRIQSLKWKVKEG